MKEGNKMYEEITAAAVKTTEEIIEVAGLKKGQILVVGCSTSEICGDKIGTNSNLDDGRRHDVRPLLFESYDPG